MADKGVVWVPTAVTMQAYGRYLKQIGKKTAVALGNLDHQVEQLQAARQLGMPATFIAVKGDPTGLPDSLRNMEGLYIKGKLVG